MKGIVIGAGFAGLSAASFMAKAGWEVTVLEKHPTPGGRAGQLKERGFVFDRGPSWYWMPDIFERYFQQFGKTPSDYYSLSRLDPSYRIYKPLGYTDIPADLAGLKVLFESLEPGAALQLERFLEEAGYKYRVGMQKLVFKPGRSLSEFLDAELVSGLFRLDVFTSMKKHVHKYFSHPFIRSILEFPVLFLGALPENTPALYSLMNYADIIGGTWYPRGGIYSVVSAMHKLAEELGVRFHFSENVTGIGGDTEAVREKYFSVILERLEKAIGEPVRDSIIYKKSFGHSDFVYEYNSYKGNAYGLANTLSQTAVLKPSCRSKKIRNLFYTGQLTVPGPGVPPALISGEVVSNELLKSFGQQG